nr:MAG TPA: hypothetical protein [Bacteriophage sp.]
MELFFGAVFLHIVSNSCCISCCIVLLFYANTGKITYFMS